MDRMSESLAELLPILGPAGWLFFQAVNSEIEIWNCGCKREEPNAVN
jgi:hypothetical protein